MRNTIQPLHIAAQYLAAAGKSFTTAKEDDSHTNLGWANEYNEIRTWPLSKNGEQLALNYPSFSLVWIDQDTRAELSLAGKSHQHIVSWISDQAQKSGLDKEYEFKLHYELPYPFPNDDFKFGHVNLEEFSITTELIRLGYFTLKDALEDFGLESEIRVWPHHFDLGAYAFVNDELALGMGLAIPDDKIQDFYFYISAYKGEESVETKDFKELTYGQWQTAEWKAATLPVDRVDQLKLTQFFKESITAFKS